MFFFDSSVPAVPRMRLDLGCLGFIGSTVSLDTSFTVDRGSDGYTMVVTTHVCGPWIRLLSVDRRSDGYKKKRRGIFHGVSQYCNIKSIFLERAFLFLRCL